MEGRCNLAAATAVPTAVPREIVSVIANEMACGIERAVDCWMSQIDQVLNDIHLTSLGRLNAVREIVSNYKNLTGKDRLEGRSRC